MTDIANGLSNGDKGLRARLHLGGRPLRLLRRAYPRPRELPAARVPGARHLPHQSLGGHTDTIPPSALLFLLVVRLVVELTAGRWTILGRGARSDVPTARRA